MKPSKLKLALAHLIEHRRPAMVWGPPGAGKSEVMTEVVNGLGRELRDVRLSTMDVVDVRGFPVPDMEAQVMKWLTANFLPPMTVKSKPNKSKGVLFLDELNSAPPATQAAMYQLMLNFRIGDYVLPEGWSIIAAGNRKTDRSVVHDMPSALANRLVHLDYEVDADDWDNWARSAGISSATRGFLRFRPSLLHSFDANARAWPSCRTWAFADRDIRGHGLPKDVELDMLSGTVGPGPAAEYQAYCQMADQLPRVEQILAEPLKAPLSDQPNVLYATATMLDTHLNLTNIEAGMKYVERMPAEFQVLTMRGALNAHADLTQNGTFTKWLSKNSSLLIG